MGWGQSFQHTQRSSAHEPVFIILGRVLAVQSGCSSVHAVGGGDAGILFLPDAAVREVQQRPLLIGRQVSRHKSWRA